MTRLQNIIVATLLGNSNVLLPGHHYQKFKFHQQQEALAAHFDFTSFSAQPFLDSWLQPFLNQGCFGWDKVIIRNCNISLQYDNGLNGGSGSVLCMATSVMPVEITWYKQNWISYFHAKSLLTKI